MFSLVPVFATTHFYDAFKFMTALNKTSFKNIFAFCLLIGQLNNSFTYSRLLFTLSLHNSLDALKDITTLVCDLFGWSCFFLACIGDRSLNNNNTAINDTGLPCGDANFSINYPLYNSRVGKKLFIGIAVKCFSFVAFWIKNQLCMINVPTFPELSELGLILSLVIGSV